MSSGRYGNQVRQQLKKQLGSARRTLVELKRATYYLRPDQIKALKLRAVLDDENISTIVRTALDDYLNISKSEGLHEIRSLHAKPTGWYSSEVMAMQFTTRSGLTSLNNEVIEFLSEKSQ